MTETATGAPPFGDLSRSPAFDYHEAFSRNSGLVSEAEQGRLRQTRVAIAGLGGVGGAHLTALARLGIGRFTLSDYDRFELVNMNRQVGATLEALGKEKVEVMCGMVRSINPSADLRVFRAGVDPGNIDAFLQGSLVAVDGIDFFNIAARRLLFRKAREHGMYAITAAPVGFGATLHVFGPTGMSFDEYFDLRDTMSLEEQLVHFGLGLAPRLAHIGYFPPSALDLTGRHAPSLGSACLLTSVLVATEVANLVLRRRSVREAPRFAQFDPLVPTYKTGRLWWGNRNPVQRVKKWWVLRKHPSLRAAINAH